MWALFSGLAFEIAAAVVEVIGSDPHEDIGHIKTAAIKLFDNLESHDQGVFYFQESKDDASSGGGGALEATWAVLRGSAALAAVLPAKLKVPSAHGTTHFVGQVEVEKMFGIAKFLLTLALSTTEAFYQLDSLSVLEDYRPAVPVSVQTSSTLSLSLNDNLEVKSEGHSSYMSGGPVKSDITTISAIGISDVQLAVLDSNTGIPDFSALYITQTYVSPL
ncbi:unnamed protein product [Sphagnum balticum]